MSLPSGSIYVRKGRECPHCGKDSGCAIHEDGSIWCLRVESVRDVAEGSGFRFVSALANGMGSFLVPGGVEYGRIKEEWAGYNQPRNEDKLAKLLSVSDRHIQYSAVLENLSLFPKNAEDLQQRGLTAEEITLAGFKTWDTRTHAEGATRALAGIGGNGKSLLGADGIFLPAYDPQRRITGAQLKPDHGSPKYMWLSSANYGGNGPHLPNGDAGELPLFVWKQDDSSEIWLCEGALKPAIASFRSGKNFIGAAGNNFTGSRETLASYLKQLKARRIVIAPDAGAINNRPIAILNHKLIKLLQAWARLEGYEVFVAWWGQSQKSDLDIDDLLVAGGGDRIQLISPDEFFALHPVGIRERLQPDIPQRKGLKLSDFPAPVALEKEEREIAYYPEGNRKQMWGRLVQEGVKVVLDSSVMGTGKSHSAGELIASDFGKFNAENIIYITNDPRNPTTETLQDWTILQGRHNGLVEECIHLPTGEFETQIRRAKTPEPSTVSGNNPKAAEKKELHTPPNCDRTDLAQILIAKNLPPDSESVCCGCPHKTRCAIRTGEFDFLAKRIDALGADKLIAHPSSLAPDVLKEGTILILEEASQMEWTKKYVVGQADVATTFADILKDCHDDASDEAIALIEILSPLYEKINDVHLPRYGLTHQQIVEMCIQGNNLEIVNNEIVERYSGQDTSYMKEAEEYEGADAESQKALKGVRSMFQNRERLMEQAQRMRLRWLPDFIAALRGEPGIRLHLDLSGMQITRPNEQIVSIIKHPGVIGAILLDGTESPSFFQQSLGMPVVEVRQEEPKEQAVITIKQIIGNGLCGASQGARQQHRTKQLIESIREKHGYKVPTINFKKLSEEGDGRWFVESRGRNLYQNEKVLILAGVPLSNLGQSADEFSSLYGRQVNVQDFVIRSYTLNANNIPVGGPWWTSNLQESADAEFAAWYRRKALAEIDQAIGRLRGVRRPGEKLTIYFISDYPLDREVEVCKMTDLIEMDSTNEHIADAIAQLEAEGKQPTTRSIAKAAKCSCGTVSKSDAYQQWKNRPQPLPHIDSAMIPNAIYINSARNQSENPDLIENCHYPESISKSLDSIQRLTVDGDLVTYDRYPDIVFRMVKIMTDKGICILESENYPAPVYASLDKISVLALDSEFHKPHNDDVIKQQL